jgi:hypothetical protein
MLPLPAGEGWGEGESLTDSCAPDSSEVFNLTLTLPTNLPLNRPPDTLSPSEGEREWVKGRFRGPMGEVSLGRILSLKGEGIGLAHG